MCPSLSLTLHQITAMRLNQATLLFFVFHSFIFTTFCYNFLITLPSASISHHIVYRPLIKGLLVKGHQITLVTPFPFEEDFENLKQINISYIKQSWGELFNAETNKLNPISLTLKIINGCLEIAESIVSFIGNSTLDDHYDGIMVEYTGIPIEISLKYKYNVPIIGVSSMDEIEHRALGNDWHPVHYAPAYIDIDREDANIFERVYAVLTFAVKELILLPYFYHKCDQIVEKSSIFGTGYPKSSELIKSIDLMLVDAPPALGFMRPVLPKTVQLGLMHINDQPSSLPDDIQELLDNSKHGVIYFSLGSIVKSTKIDDHLVGVFSEVFKTLKYDVIWKWEGQSFDNKPENVKLVKWIAQQDLLRHKKIKLFIMQGGQTSIAESVFNGVPLLAIPFFTDHKVMAKRIERIGIGRRLQLKDVTQASLTENINELIDNESYRKMSRQIGEIMRDTPLSSIDTAIWWIEYTIRHNGTRHFNYPFGGISFWKYYLIDVWLSFALLLVSIVFGLKLLTRNYYKVK